MADFLSSLMQATKPKLNGPLNLAALNPFPQKYRHIRGRSRQKSNVALPNPNDVTHLQTSFNVSDSIRALQRHRWTPLDLQYLFLAALIMFCMYITPSAPLLKLVCMIGASIIFLMPVTRQFFWPALPVWSYLLYFFCSRFIPAGYRPHIWVRVLPALENVLYGANLSNILSAHTHPILDLLAWLPYGICHFGAPLVCALIMFAFSAPGTAPVFAKALGWMNVLGVTIQLIFPCTPPWYENERGLVPAAYGMPGSPAGLARVDKILGVDMYTTSFTTAPLPFGAFPSMHSGNAVLEAMFMSYCFPHLRPLFIAYVGWIWWATMYLSHHYAIDLVGGALIALAFFYFARTRFLPRRQADKAWRWDYEYVEYGERRSVFDEEFSAYSLGVLGPSRLQIDSDEWTVGSSSGITSSSGSVSGSMSPVTDDTPRRSTFSMELEENGTPWESTYTTTESEINEVVLVR
ncbi:hypothetical protein BROUX41_000388 [Berkeleyomyces rouxiae]|uniref:uncharacterized protein n=1 Tax=Berkeleyomyces rouxiae TaxID=2035830 RepID=UPI003B7E64F9